jgi:aconitate hydratase
MRSNQFSNLPLCAQSNSVKNQATGEYGPVPDVARYYKANNIQWCVLGEHNFGEGSARESAAM